jgi:predicted nucleotidyltransferase
MYTEQELVDKLTLIFKQFPVKRAALFGSYSRNEQASDSDLDIVLELDQSNELPDIIYVIWDELENSIKLKIDILTFKGLNGMPSVIRERILKDLRYIYEV